MTRTLFVALSSALLIACPAPTAGNNGGGGGGGGSSVPTTGEAMKQEVGNFVCNAIVDCNASRSLVAVMKSYGREYLTHENCMEMMAGDGADLDRIADAMAAGRVTINSEAYVACRTEIQASDCGNFGGDSASCEAVFVGSVEVGGGCYIDEECADGDGEGSCTAEDDQCGVCEQLPAPAAAGGDCSEDGRCVAGYDCRDGICTEEENDTLGSAGEACSNEQGGLHGDCKHWEDLLCVNGTCTAAEFTSDAGAECGANGVLCDGDLVCSITEGGIGDCERPGAIGASCIVMDDQGVVMRACAAGAFCNMQTRNCEAKLADGEACDESNHCSSGYCDWQTDTCMAEEADASWQACN